MVNMSEAKISCFLIQYTNLQSQFRSANYLGFIKNEIILSKANLCSASKGQKEGSGEI